MKMWLNIDLKSRFLQPHIYFYVISTENTGITMRFQVVFSWNHLFNYATLKQKTWAQKREIKATFSSHVFSFCFKRRKLGCIFLSSFSFSSHVFTHPHTQFINSLFYSISLQININPTPVNLTRAFLIAWNSRKITKKLIFKKLETRVLSF